MKITSLTLIITLCLSLAVWPVAAQDVLDQDVAGCDVVEEAIVTLLPSRLGVPTVWDAIHGNDDVMVQFHAGVPLKEGTVLAYGRELSAGDLKPEKTFLIELNRRGRILNQQSWQAKGKEKPVDLLRISNGFLSVSNIEGTAKADQKIRLSWYGDKAKFFKDQVKDSDKFHLQALGLAPAAGDGNGFVLITQATGKRQEGDNYGLLTRFDDSGKLLWERAYRPGIPNQINALLPLSDGSYLAAGSIRIESGRKAGWLVKLDGDGSILWQRILPRGKAASLSKSVAVSSAYNEGAGYVLLGLVEPLDNGPTAVWVLRINAFGETVWQRYLRRGDTGYQPAGLIRENDGRLTVVLNAVSGKESGQRNHVRILTLAPEGPVIGDESYIAGIEAHASDVMPGWNSERIIVATILSDEKPLNIEMVGDKFVVAEPNPSEQNQSAAAEITQDEGGKEPVHEGWVFVATALDPYEDPCNE